MNKVCVNTSRPYEILIGSGIMKELGQQIKSIHAVCTAAIITDSNVGMYYLESVKISLAKAGFAPVVYSFPAGEVSKNAETYLNILNFLAQNHITRSDILIALGGGVVGDLTGFVAATYLRGLAYVQVPTSLLAMVDSSVGGKTAIDLPAGKNLVGAFHQPALVVCDTDALNTLPKHFFTDGCAEVLKYSILYDRALFDHLMEKGLDFDKEYVISRCVTLKSEVVCSDEFDTGLRQKLNLGHTFGHSIEKLSDFSISHGYAVAMGIRMAAKVGAKLALCSCALAEQIQEILQVFDLNHIPPFGALEMSEAAKNDKKRTGHTINLILPCSIGHCVIHPVDVYMLESLFEAGL